MSFLVAGVIVQSTSALDGGVYCNTLPSQNERAICLKLNGITLILSIAIPIMLAIIVYKIGKDQKSECRLSRKKRLLHK